MTGPRTKASQQPSSKSNWPGSEVEAMLCFQAYTDRPSRPQNSAEMHEWPARILRWLAAPVSRGRSNKREKVSKFLRMTDQGIRLS